ncbi:hypothetical protein ACOCEA_03420 [Maribacter sp. CXY002]|uniref:hypothetical protein n=1 Tax=Maribacter luteocoastalis TaxID=3407671 RepID=UPI003B678241
MESKLDNAVKKLFENAGPSEFKNTINELFTGWVESEMSDDVDCRKTHHYKYRRLIEFFEQAEETV